MASQSFPARDAKDALHHAEEFIDSVASHIAIARNLLNGIHSEMSFDDIKMVLDQVQESLDNAEYELS